MGVWSEDGRSPPSLPGELRGGGEILSTKSTKFRKPAHRGSVGFRLISLILLLHKLALQGGLGGKLKKVEIRGPEMSPLRMLLTAADQHSHFCACLALQGHN